eukprot:1741828-Rhodomonas_salina.3
MSVPQCKRFTLCQYRSVHTIRCFSTALCTPYAMSVPNMHQGTCVNTFARTKQGRTWYEVCVENSGYAVQTLCREQVVASMIPSIATSGPYARSVPGIALCDWGSVWRCDCWALGVHAGPGCQSRCWCRVTPAHSTRVD